MAVEEELKKNIDHLSDVTVHIDPEDDEEAPPCEGLPLRGEVLAFLQDIWQEEDEACLSAETEIKLHYLSGKIDIDLLLPLRCYKSVEDTQRLRTALNNRIEQDTRFGAIEIFYKAPK